MNSSYEYIARTNIIDIGQDEYTFNLDSFTIYDDFVITDSLFYVIQKGASSVELENGLIKEKNYFESHIEIAQDDYELLASPYSKIKNTGFEDISYTILFYVNTGNKPLNITFDISGEVNNLNQSLQEITQDVIDLEIIDESIEVAGRFTEEINHRVFRLNVPRDLQFSNCNKL